MNLRRRIARWLLKDEQKQAARQAMAISRFASDQLRSKARPPLVPWGPEPPKSEDIFKAPDPPAWLPEKVREGVIALAADQALSTDGWADAWGAFNWAEGIGFFGYQFLAELSQRVEYRKAVENFALDITREWIRFTYVGDEDKSDKIRQLDAEWRRLDVQGVFRRATELEGFYGRSHIYPDLGDANKPNELKTPLVIDPAKIKKNSLKRLQVVDPTWTYPGVYNTTDPLHQHYYRPTHWYVMTKAIHESRLFTLVTRPVPDLLKPAYIFGGLALTQLMKPYVDNWLRNRQSVSDLLHSFTVFALKTNMASFLLGGDATQLDLRADTFNALRDNRGLMLLDKGDGTAGGDPGEELTNISVPLNGVNELLSGSQEQMAFSAGQPLVKYLGVTPSGLNASSDGEVRIYYDTVAGTQERVYRRPLTELLKLTQLSLWGAVDEDIDFEFLPLWQLDELQQAQARKLDAEIIDAHVNAGLISPEEGREAMAADKHGPWANLQPDQVPEDPDADLARAQLAGLGQENESTKGPAGSADRPRGPPKAQAAANDAAPAAVYSFQGMPIVVETPKGAIRSGIGPGGIKWRSKVAADYGYIMDTWSAEGRNEGMDCFVGPARDAPIAYVIDQMDVFTGQFDEHKCMLGYASEADALEDYASSFSDGRGYDRVLDVSAMPMDDFRQWLAGADLYRPAKRLVGP